MVSSQFTDFPHRTQVILLDLLVRYVLRPLRCGAGGSEQERAVRYVAERADRSKREQISESISQAATVNIYNVAFFFKLHMWEIKT